MRPRIRSLKPELWQDEHVGGLSHSARLLFVGLITMADDEGRLRELPALILGHVFPYDDVKPAAYGRWMNEVGGTGMIVRYEVNGGQYIAFRHWSRHQKVDKPKDSGLPPPPDFADVSSNGSANESGNDPRSGRGTVGERSRPARTRASRSDPDPSPSAVSEQRKTREGWEAELALFSEWQTVCGHSQAKPTRERLSKIRQRRHEGYTDGQIRQAIAGASRAAFVNEQGKRFDDIELICRNGSKLESFIERATSAPSSSNGSKGRDSSSDWLDQIEAGEVAA